MFSPGLEEQIVNDLLDELNDDKLVLPTLPEVVLKVRDTIEDENVTVAKIAEVIKTDEIHPNLDRLGSARQCRV